MSREIFRDGMTTGYAPSNWLLCAQTPVRKLTKKQDITISYSVR